jgi:hypothetical protein
VIRAHQYVEHFPEEHPFGIVVWVSWLFFFFESGIIESATHFCPTELFQHVKAAVQM